MASSGNFSTLNPLWKTSNITYGDGNLKATTNTSNRGHMSGWAIPNNSKWYWEVYVTMASGHEFYIGINYADVDFTGVHGGDKKTGVNYDSYDGTKWVDNSNSSYGASYGNGDIIGVAVDRVNNTIQFYKNNSAQGTIDISGIAQQEYYAWGGSTGGTGTMTLNYNFGQDSTFAGLTSAGGNADGNGFGDFKYSPPSGFVALCSANLPISDDIDPAQTSDDFPQKQFGVVLYTGNGGASLSVTGLGFQPDLVWLKQRSTGEAYSNNLIDSTRGRAKVLYSSRTNAEATSASDKDFGSFDSDGFTVQDDYESNMNQSTITNVAWCWRANGGTEATNNDGTGTSYVQANQAAGFSITRYTGTGSALTVGHGLAQEPEFTIIKDRDSSVNWIVYTKIIDGSLDYLFLNTTASKADSGLTGPNSSIWNFNSASSYSNTSSRNYIMYNWHSVEGFSKFGTYEGNGNSDGPFIYTGFRPRFVLTKGTASSGWNLRDSARSPNNTVNEVLQANTTSAEMTSNYDVQFFSNGFKILATAGDSNTNGNVYAYGAWGDVPFKYNNTF